MRGDITTVIMEGLSREGHRPEEAKHGKVRKGIPGGGHCWCQGPGAEPAWRGQELKGQGEWVGPRSGGVYKDRARCPSRAGTLCSPPLTLSTLGCHSIHDLTACIVFVS